MTQRAFNDNMSALIAVLKLDPRTSVQIKKQGLEAMDIQNCLCEFDKYRRLTLKEGKVRSRYPGAA